MESLYWLILFIVLLVIEVATLGLTTIWFAGGALVAFFSSLAGAHEMTQFVLFAIISLVLLFFTRPIAARYLNQNRIKTNADSLVGQTGVVSEPIQNLLGEGQVTINGMEWMARTKEDGIVIEKDRKVEILEIQGVKLIVREKKEEE